MAACPAASDLEPGPLPPPTDVPLASPARPPPLVESPDAVELADSFASTGRVSLSLSGNHHHHHPASWRERLGLAGVARRTMGISMLLVTVFLWTTSNFLASSIFSDQTYNKPFFVVYCNSSIFAFAMIPMLVRYTIKHGISGVRDAAVQAWREQGYGIGPLRPSEGDGTSRPDERLLLYPTTDEDDHDDAYTDGTAMPDPDAVLRRHAARSAHEVQLAGDEKLTLGETARLSVEFSMLWFFANYTSSACLEYTSVSSATILTSTSSIWTLVFCGIMRVEGFTVRKLLGVAASISGIVLISTVDLSGSNDENRGSFPQKSKMEIAIGDSMAFVSAVVYGLYITVMKLKVGNEDRVDLPVFLGLVGVFNLAILWPGFIILHLLGIETFEMPPTARVWYIIVANSLFSFVSDMSWAYAMLLTTPLVVTVGLSMTIPLSLVGEMIQYSQYSSIMYWIGAGVVVASFLFINHESHEDDETRAGS